MNIYKNIVRIFNKYRGKEENSINYENIKMIMKNDSNALLIDVRSMQEYKEKHLKGSINISLYDIERGNFKIKDKNTTIIVYCEWGKRSKRAMEILRKRGYTKVYQLEGGIDSI